MQAKTSHVWCVSKHLQGNSALYSWPQPTFHFIPGFFRCAVLGYKCIGLTWKCHSAHKLFAKRKEKNWYRLHGDHLDDSCIKMDSDESHFNVSLTVRDSSQDGVHRPQHLKTKASRSGELNRRRPLQYQPDAFPPDQTSSPGLYGACTSCYRQGTTEWDGL